MFKNFIAATAFAILLSLHTVGTLHAGEYSFSRILQPLQGITFTMGDSYAVIYYSVENGRCVLVVTSAGEPDWDNSGVFTTTRFETAIPAGGSARYPAGGSQPLAFKCQTGAQALLVESEASVLAAASR